LSDLLCSSAADVAQLLVGWKWSLLIPTACIVVIALALLSDLSMTLVLIFPPDGMMGGRELPSPLRRRSGAVSVAEVKGAGSN
jgi:hypothetical protein